MNERATPETDSLEARIESEGKRDVPVRVYQEMRRLERQRDELAEALQEYYDAAEANAKACLAILHHGGDANETSRDRWLMAGKKARAALANVKGGK